VKDKRKGWVMVFWGTFFILALGSIALLVAQPWLECRNLEDCPPGGTCGEAPLTVYVCKLKCPSGRVVICYPTP
jgi:hypothetical protein